MPGTESYWKLQSKKCLVAFTSHIWVIWVLLPSADAADAADAIASWWKRERQSCIISAELKLQNLQKQFLVHRIQTSFVFFIPRYWAVLCGIYKKHQETRLNDKLINASSLRRAWKCATSTEPDSLLRKHWRDFVRMEADCESAGQNKHHQPHHIFLPIKLAKCNIHPVLPGSFVRNKGETERKKSGWILPMNKSMRSISILSAKLKGSLQSSTFRPRLTLICTIGAPC